MEKSGSVFLERTELQAMDECVITWLRAQEKRLLTQKPSTSWLYPEARSSLALGESCRGCVRAVYQKH